MVRCVRRRKAKLQLRLFTITEYLEQPQVPVYGSGSFQNPDRGISESPHVHRRRHESGNVKPSINRAFTGKQNFLRKFFESLGLFVISVGNPDFNKRCGERSAAASLWWAFHDFDPGDPEPPEACLASGRILAAYPHSEPAVIVSLR